LQRHEFVAKYRLCKSDKCVTIPVAIEVESFLAINNRNGAIRSACACSEDDALIGWIGRMCNVKAPEIFVESASLVLQKNSQARFVMVGDGELRSRIESQIAKEPKPKTIFSVGWIHDLPSFYSDLDVVVLTSRHEGTPLVLLEAMGSGKPFVATDVGGIPDLLVGAGRKMPGFEVFDNGIIAQSKPSAIAAAIRYLLADQERSRRMGVSGREFVSRSFSQRRLFDDIERLYEGLIQQKNLNAADLRKSIFRRPGLLGR
jgi:glycosyltransferase involved in cell wall biosynthesis